MASNSALLVAYNLRVNASLDIKFRHPPKAYKDLMRALELIKDNYKGFTRDKELILFFYVMSGFFSKYVNKIGNFYNYQGTLSGVFNLMCKNITPRFPINYEFNGDDGGIHPNFLITFHLSIRESDMSHQSLYDYMKEHSPSKYRKRNKVKMSIFDDYPVSITVKQKVFILTSIKPSATKNSLSTDLK
nr:MAG: matrix protein [Ohlsdorf virus]